MLRHRSVSRVLQKTPEIHEWSRLSGQFDSCLFCCCVIHFLITKEISVTSDKKRKRKKKSCLFNDFGLKCFLRSTNMHEIDYTFFFFFFFFSFLFFGGGGGAGGGVHCTNLV